MTRRLLSMVVLAGLVGACGDDDAAGGGEIDASSEVDADVVDADEGIPAGYCGPGPYATFSAVITSQLDMEETIEGATVTVDICDDREFVSDEDGIVTWEMTLDVEFAGRIVAEGYIPTMTTNEMIQDDLDTDGPLLPVALIPTIPHWSEDEPTIMVVGIAIPPALPKDAGAGCLSPAGMTVSIAGEAEALVTYYEMGEFGPTPNAKLTEMTEVGMAEISGLDPTTPNETYTVEVDLPDCQYETANSYPHLERIQAADGFLTGVPVFIPGTPWPNGLPD